MTNPLLPPSSAHGSGDSSPGPSPAIRIPKSPRSAASAESLCLADSAQSAAQSAAHSTAHSTAQSAAQSLAPSSATNGASESRAPLAPLASLEWLAFCYVAHELSEAERTEFEERLAADQAAREAVAAAVEMVAAISLAGETEGAGVAIRDRATEQNGNAGCQANVEPLGSAASRTVSQASCELQRPELQRPELQRPAWRRSRRRVASWLVVGAIASLAAVAVVDHWAGQRIRDLAQRSLSPAPGTFANKHRINSHPGNLPNDGQVPRVSLESGGGADSDADRHRLAQLWSEDRQLAALDVAADSDVDGGDGLTAELDAVDAPAWMMAAVAAKSGTLSDDTAEAASEPVMLPDTAPAPKPDAGAIP